MNTNIEESVMYTIDNLVTISEIDSSDNIRDITNISNSDTSTSSCNAAEFVADLERAFTSNPSSLHHTSVRKCCLQFQISIVKNVSS